MPRQLFVKFRPVAEKLRGSWYFRALGPRVTDPRLWGVNRRAITTAFGAAIAICFIPLPAHLIIGLVAAMIWHLNVPTVVGTLLVFNPFTAVPVYFFAYRVGALLLQIDDALAAHGGPWLLGERYSALDPYAWTLGRWTRGFSSKPARDYPHLGPYLERVMARPAVREAIGVEALPEPWV